MRRAVWLAFLLVWGCEFKGASSEDIPPVPHMEPVSIEEFGALVDTLSEPSGYFDSDNLISNESGYLNVVAKLRENEVSGGVYIGVGPDQNFTYIAKIRPAYAFILDIRRDNLLTHLLFKALFEMSGSRAEYLSLLFSKPWLPEWQPENPTIVDLIQYFESTPGDEGLFKQNWTAVRERVEGYGVRLTEEDLSRMALTYRTFFVDHLDMRWQFRDRGDQGIPFITYRDFLLGVDLEGMYGNFLHTDGDFAYVKAMQENNRIIPVTGDFAGPKALVSIADYTRFREEYVSAFYLSNVEFYLASNGQFGRFAENVAQLPIRENSMLIRAYVNLPGETHPLRQDEELLTTVLQPVASFNRIYAEGLYQSYYDTGTADYVEY
ncbi:MAG: hypothetical protein FJY97_15290 [candidate division Zixibacteria bacterium]|nr:hypothetical protein [candidate division Zixibacteria bacterium]